MRFYPKADINTYWEILPGWSLYCHNPHLTWHRRPLQPKHTIAYWQDLEGQSKESIKTKDLSIKNCSTTRIREAACLPLYYCSGNRFIRLERAFPAGFKCSTRPMSLQEVRKLNKYRKQSAKARRAKAKEDAKERKEKERMEDAKRKGKKYVRKL